MRHRLPLIVALIAVAAIAITVSSSPAPSTATGIVVAVDVRSLTDVRGFTLRKPGGETMDFVLDSLQNKVEFPPGHLPEHIGTSAPIVVTYRLDGGVAHALRLADAPTTPPS
ncbi:MAG: hypothetical protein ABIQ17_01680 [Candidatus Limnocylindrales bacterium]